jgi:Mg2+ and Co2+ transporter CorA
LIWVYTFNEQNELKASDVHSGDELESLKKENEWFWIDCLEPNEEELKIITEWLKVSDVKSLVNDRHIFSRYENVNYYVMISLPFVCFNSNIEMHPIHFFASEKIFVTMRNKDSSKLISNTLKTYQDCRARLECPAFSPFIVSRLFYEATNENLEVAMSLREQIDAIEERALSKPSDKKISKSVFSLKREISSLERILWAQREKMLNIKEGVIPIIETSGMGLHTLNYAINNVSRELSIINSYDSALDSVLNLQDLGMIHRVEKGLIILTAVTLLVNIIMIIIELGIKNVLGGSA